MARKQPQTTRQGHKIFLEVGIDSGNFSLYMACLGLAITGVYINPDAVETTKKNFAANDQKGSLVVSNLFTELNDQNLILSSGITFDNSATIAEGERYLTEDRNLLLELSCYDNVYLLKIIAPKYNYNAEIITTDREALGGAAEEEYYIIRLNSAL